MDLRRINWNNDKNNDTSWCRDPAREKIFKICTEPKIKNEINIEQVKEYVCEDFYAFYTFVKKTK